MKILPTRNPIYLILYSGGVDSVLCLVKAVEQGIIPFIFHFHTQKLNKTHERMIRKTARLISPDSPFYVFETKTVGYRARADYPPDVCYEVCIDDPDGKGKRLNPLDHADYVIIGYTKWLYPKRKGRMRPIKKHQNTFINGCKKFGSPFIFPLADYTRNQIDEEFKKLPLEIRKNAVSTTRYYDGDWRIVRGESGK